MKKKEGPTARRECGQRENVFPGRWEPARRAHRASEGGFPRLSRARHFHGAPSWSSEPGAEFSDTVHELTLGALHFQGGFGVGLELCELFEFGQRHARSQQALARRHFLEQLERRSPARIDTAALAVGCGDHHRHGARPVEVDLRMEMLAVKRIDRRGVLRVDVAEAEVFANHGAILGFH